MPTHKLSDEIIAAAIEGFEEQKQRIDSQIAHLRAMLSGDGAVPAAEPEAPTGKRKFSAAARRHMKEAQQQRWAKIRGQSEASSEPATSQAPKKRKLSAAGRAAIIAATKMRWALKRAETAKAKPAAKK
jgi:hypothetical protein